MSLNHASGSDGKCTSSMPNPIQFKRCVQGRVLIVDGSDTIRMLLTDALRKQNLEVIEAGDGRQVSRLATMKPKVDAILMDAQLASVDGFEVCRRLKNDAELYSIPVILMINLGSHKEIEDAISAGADEVLGKPFCLAELRVRIMSLLQHHRERERRGGGYRGSREFLDVEEMAVSMAHAVAIKNGYGYGHVDLVINYTLAFAKGLGLGAADLKRLHFAAILHSVGKITIPDAICERPGPFTKQERDRYAQCSSFGTDVFALLHSYSAGQPAKHRDEVASNGAGHSKGRHREFNAFDAELVGIIDAYIALTNDRPFRQGKTHSDAIEIVMDRAKHGIHPPQLAIQFCEWINEVVAECERPCRTSVDLSKPISSLDELIVNNRTPLI